LLPKPAAPVTRSPSRGGGGKPTLEAPACWQYPQAALTGVLPQQQPFRADTMKTTTLAWLSADDADEDTLVPHRVEAPHGVRRNERLYVPAEEMLDAIALKVAPSVSRWGQFDLLSLVSGQAEAQDLSLQHAAEKFTTVEVPESGQGWLWHPWLGLIKKR